MAYNTITADTRSRAGLITLNRPKALNALNSELMDEVNRALAAFEADEKVGAVVITGSEKAFAAGADIKEMQSKTFAEAYGSDWLANWNGVATARKPIIAAVSGYALGGGCELAMMCDMIFASETAKFGQPEITLGIIPGAGGTQRLVRSVGKSVAMDLILTGRTMDAEEALRVGLVARVMPYDKLLDGALNAANKIAGFSNPSVMMAKEAVDAAYETTLAQGTLFERRLFHALFATEDQKEGMSAFVEKRRPQFKGR